MKYEQSTVTFYLANPPIFYVCGNLEINSKWHHKHMYQEGNWEIIFVLSGTLYMDIDGVRYAITKNQYLLVPPYKDIDGYQDSPIGTEILWIHFFPKALINEDDPSKLDKYHLVTLPIQGKLFDRNSVIVEAYHVLSLSQKRRGFSVDVAVCQLLVTLENDYNQAILRRQDTNSTIENVDTWISAHLDHIQSNRDIGLAFNFNPVYLNKLFKDMHHVSLYQYVLTKKVEKAEQLLLSTSIPISEVSRRSYFNDKRNFLRTFKKRVGVTPETYRKLFTKKFINSPTYDPEIPVSSVLKNKLAIERQCQ